MSLSDHSLILKNNGTLWGTGHNGYGQLGLGDNINRTTFTQATINADNIKSVCCGGSHTFILENDGTLWSCGDNSCGQLGFGDTTNRTTFTQVTTNTDNVKSVYCGWNFTFILKNDGTLWGCGANNVGQLGLGDTNNRNTFTQITTNANDVKSVHCGHSFNFMLKNNGTLWSTGHNGYGQLGLGDSNHRYTFTQITTNVDNIKQVYCGAIHTFILKNDGTLWGCGYNEYGVLGLGDAVGRYIFTQITTNANDIKLICCSSYHHAIALKNDGTLWSTGHNGYGQLGLGDSNHRYTFTQITTNADDIKQIYCGYHHTIVLKNDGTLWGTGLNNCGQLGLGNTNNINTFTKITTNTDNIKSLSDQYDVTTMQIYDLNTGLVETLDTNNFRNIPVNKFEKIKVLYTNPTDTLIAGLISFDNKTTWKVFDGSTWNVISDITPNNILLNGMDMQKINELDKSKLIAGGFAGDIDFRIAMKTKDVNKTPSITKIYIQYKK